MAGSGPARRSAAEMPLGDDLLAQVLSKLGPADLGAAEATCRRWCTAAAAYSLWRAHADVAAAQQAEQQRLEQQQQRGEGEQQQQPGADVAAAAAADVAPARRQQQQEQQELQAGGFAQADWKRLYLDTLWGHVFSHPLEYVRTVRMKRQAHSGEITAIHALGSLVASASADRSLCLWGLAGPRPQLLARALHPAPVLFVQLLSPGTAVSATATSAFLWSIQGAAAAAAVTAAAAAAAGAAASSSSGAGGASGASSSSGSGSGGSRGVEFRLVRRMAVDGTSAGSSSSSSSSSSSAIKCAAAWDQYLAVGCADGSVRVLDTYSGALVKLLRLHQGGGGVTAVQHVAHGSLDLLVSGGGDGRLLVTDAASTLTLAEAALPRGGVSCLLLDAESGRLLAGTATGSYSHLCWTAGRQLSGLPTPAQRLGMAGNARLSRVVRHRGPACLTSLALPRFAGGGRYYLCGDSLGSLHVCSAQTGDAVSSFQPPRPDGQASATAAAAAAAEGPYLQYVSPALSQRQQQDRRRQQQLPPAAAGQPQAASSSRQQQQQQPVVGQQQQQQQLPGRPGLLFGRSLRQQRCTSLCADTMPIVAGFGDGRLVFWRWRPQPRPAAAEAAAAAAAAEAALAGVRLPA